MPDRSLLCAASDADGSCQGVDRTSSTARSGLVRIVHVIREVDGSQGAIRAPKQTCTLNADNNYQAVQAWLSLHASAATRRAYRKQAERLILWAVLEPSWALSSLTVEDAIAYRAFLRKPSPANRWVGPAKPRTSPKWRPFGGPLSSKSVSYAVSIIGALYRWLMEQGYLLANPFSASRFTARPRPA